MVSRDGRNGSLTVHQDMKLYVSKMDPDTNLKKSFNKDRKIWVQVARGKITLNGHTLEAGDGAAITNEDTIEFNAKEKSEFLVFDLRK